jgi:hypothetical protein
MRVVGLVAQPFQSVSLQFDYTPNRDYPFDAGRLELDDLSSSSCILLWRSGSKGLATHTVVTMALYPSEVERRITQMSDSCRYEQNPFCYERRPGTPH